MSHSDLRKLWVLHEVDAAIQLIRNQAAHLDFGQKQAAQIEKIQKENQDFARYSALRSQESELELQIKGFTEKVAKIDKSLFDGSVSQVREIENLQKERTSLTERIATSESEALALIDEIEKLKPVVSEVKKHLAQLSEEIKSKREQAELQKPKLEEEFARLKKLRVERLKEVPPLLVTKYEALRKRLNSTGMASIGKKGTCDACGMMVPLNAQIRVQKGDWVTCENCHRALYMDHVTIL